LTVAVAASVVFESKLNLYLGSGFITGGGETSQFCGRLDEAKLYNVSRAPAASPTSTITPTLVTQPPSRTGAQQTLGGTAIAATAPANGLRSQRRAGRTRPVAFAHERAALDYELGRAIIDPPAVLVLIDKHHTTGTINQTLSLAIWAQATWKYRLASTR